MKNLENDLFPACAGVIPSQASTSQQVIPFPRVCGGDPFDVPIVVACPSLFPACAGVILL